MKLLLTAFLMALPALAAFPNGYSHCKLVTTSVTMVSGTSDLVNYPLTVVVTDADLRTTPNGGLVNNSSGHDIGFYPDCSGSGTALKWEVDSYSPITGAIVAHVLRPVLSHTNDDTVGMFYGGPFSTFQSTANNVWNSNYKLVAHLPNGVSLTTDDSTGSFNFSNTGPVTATAGKLNGGATGFALGKGLSNTGGTPFNSADWTAEAWVYRTGAIVTYGHTILAHGQAGNTAGHWYFYINSSNLLDIDIPFVKGNVLVGNTTVPTNTWVHAVATKSGNVYTLYYNGISDGSITDASAPTLSGSVYGGSFQSTLGNPIVGSLDELRISNVARSADWILTEYRNQSAPATYLSVGPRIVPGGSRIRHSVRSGS